MSRHPIVARSALSLAALAFSAGFAASADEGGVYRDIQHLRIEDYVGRIDISVGGDEEVQVQIDREGAKPYEIDLSASKGVLRIEGEDRGPFDGWSRGWGGLERRLNDYPRLQIVVPVGTDVSLDDVATELEIGDIESDLALGGGVMAGEIGDVRTADLHISGEATLDIGDVAEALDLRLSGAGDLKIASAGTADISLRGAGDIELGPVGGPVEVSIQGGGDVAIGAAEGGAELEIHGSGDIGVASVAGPTSAAIHGSGDIVIGGGRADPLEVSIHGSGDVRHEGVAVNPRVRVHGSGEVFINEQEGALESSGHGRLKIGRQG